MLPLSPRVHILQCSFSSMFCCWKLLEIERPQSHTKILHPVLNLYHKDINYQPFVYKQYFFISLNKYIFSVFPN
jgi:hypothetical protein